MIALTQLHEQVDDTTLLLSNEAYSAALGVYQYAKNSDDHSLDALVDELGRRFTRHISPPPQP